MNSILEIHSENDSLFGVTPKFMRITSGIVCMTEIDLSSDVDFFVGTTAHLRRALLLLENDVYFEKNGNKLVARNDSLGIALDPSSENDEVLSEIPVNLHLYSIDYDLKSFGIAIRNYSQSTVEISINPNGELSIGNMILYPITPTSAHRETVKISTKFIKKFVDILRDNSVIKICISPPSRFIIDNCTFYIAPICDEDTTQP